MPTAAGEANTWESTFSGVVSSDTVWNANLLLTGDVTVPADVTLTVESGVTIFASAGSDDQNGGVWNDKTELIVFGTLKASQFMALILEPDDVDVRLAQKLTIWGETVRKTAVSPHHPLTYA